MATWLQAGALLAGLAAPALVAPAAAHPHVLIENRVTLKIEGVRLIGFALEWTFDEMFSADIVQRFDRDRNRRFEPAEIARIEQDAFGNLHKYDWFTHVRVGDRKLDTARVSGFTAALDRGAVTYRFDLTLPEPVPLRGAPVRAGFYDPEYYVDVAFAESRAHAAPGLPADCRIRRREDAENPIYFGLVSPEIIEVTCAGS